MAEHVPNTGNAEVDAELSSLMDQGLVVFRDGKYSITDAGRRALEITDAGRREQERARRE